jgi:hypothetical protein
MACPTEQQDQAFTLFPDLPAELRLQIWKLSCAHRVVTMIYDPTTDRYLTSTFQPTILQVNHESRLEGQRLYKQVPFSMSSDDSPRKPDSLYFSPDLDIMYLPRHDIMGYSTAAREIGHYLPSAPPLVRRLAIDHVDPAGRKPWETYSKYCLLKSFPNLEEAYLVVSAPGSALEATGAGAQVEFIDPPGDPETILRLMEDVRESFTYEIGPGVVGVDEDKHWEAGDHHEGASIHRHAKPPVSLVPKTKTIRRNMWQPRNPSTVAC